MLFAFPRAAAESGNLPAEANERTARPLQIRQIRGAQAARLDPAREERGGGLRVGVGQGGREGDGLQEQGLGLMAGGVARVNTRAGGHRRDHTEPDRPDDHHDRDQGQPSRGVRRPSVEPARGRAPRRALGAARGQCRGHLIRPSS